ncbi:TetR/AcrR family transcriptional regulator [Actinomadura algeriensis]|uniref:AcrR family transcriptional regulator n=1 Tax=Actinomadura algeriensis TaxID=1679523 RepID=A0ABR9K512_9ACTN|nr:TetR family transcriptional regulator [Actinomadura algeriensis]MBE1537925.1 AcrR family transcriptional regulator [Actinomadura algeriensis]
MTNLADRPKGERRRRRLVDAGVALLAEGGWPAVTTRAVAERAGANVGLIHYHFGGLGALHEAIARQAGNTVVAPFLDELFAAPDERAVLAAARRLQGSSVDPGTVRLSVELMAGALREPALGEALRDELRAAREGIAGWLGRVHPDWPPGRRAGMAAVIAALIDGLLLHHMVDPELSLDDALGALEESL